MAINQKKDENGNLIPTDLRAKFWYVTSGHSCMDKFATLDEANAYAKEQAAASPGQPIHIMTSIGFFSTPEASFAEHATLTVKETSKSAP